MVLASLFIQPFYQAKDLSDNLSEVNGNLLEVEDFCVDDLWIEQVCIDPEYNETKFIISSYVFLYLDKGIVILNPEAEVLQDIDNTVWRMGD